MDRSRSRIRSARLNFAVQNLAIGLLFVLAIASFFFFEGSNLIAMLSSRKPTSPNEKSTIQASPHSAISSKRTSENDDLHPLDSVLQLARSELKKFSEQVLDYTATMRMRERIGDKLGQENQLFVKIINRRLLSNNAKVPLQVYLRFDGPSNVKGREVLWVEERNDGNMLAHEGGFMNLMRVKLAPTGTLAMMGNKYPITEIGIGNLFSKLIEKGERDRMLGDCEVTMREHEPWNGLDLVKIEVKHPNRHPDFDFHIARIYIDTDRHLPVRYESYMWPKMPGGEPLLEEQYTYSDIQLNVGLTESDFDPENKSYQFP